MKVVAVFGSLMISAGVMMAASLPPTHSGQITGNYVEARTADVYTGPCFANSEEGLRGDLAVFGWKIAKGAYNGVDLAGLGVVGVVRASSTLGAVNVSAYPIKSVLIIDQKANEEQRVALAAFAKHMAGKLLSDVVRVEYRPVELTLANNDLHSMQATLKAGELAKVQTRAMQDGDQICHNEDVWYQPLTNVSHAMPAYTVANSYEGDGLGTKWSSPDKRSSYIGSFAESSD
jgi:Protein of unknown function (DUF1326)